MKYKHKTAFTLAEVLVTLMVIGIVASSTIPTLVKNFQNKHWKTSYKKAYSDLSQAVLMGVADNSFKSRTNRWDEPTTLTNFTLLQSFFGKTKECYSTNNSECWDNNGEKLYQNTYPSDDENAFIDKAGRAWSLYSKEENIILVDTNGFDPPNKYGQDRWIFIYTDRNNTRIGESGCVSTLPEKVMPLLNEDLSYDADWCQYPTCYYKSWLIE